MPLMQTTRLRSSTKSTIRGNGRQKSVVWRTDGIEGCLLEQALFAFVLGGARIMCRRCARGCEFRISSFFTYGFALAAVWRCGRDCVYRRRILCMDSAGNAAFNLVDASKTAVHSHKRGSAFLSKFESPVVCPLSAVRQPRCALCMLLS